MSAGLHERLTNIVHEITSVNLENVLDGAFYLTAKQRTEVRRLAARLVKLMDEYDRLDPLKRS